MPYPDLLHPELLLLQQYTADPYLLRGCSQFCLGLYGVSGSWCTQDLFEPSERVCWVWGLILNAISPPYHLAGASHLPLDIACLFFVCGIQHFPVNGCSAASCNFGVLPGEGEHMPSSAISESRIDVIFAYLVLF